MEKIIKHKISRNLLTSNYGKISPNTSNSSNLVPNDKNLLTHTNNNINRKNTFKKEIKNDFIKNKKNIMTFSTDKIVFGTTINHNDIKYVFDNSNNSFINNFQSVKANTESNKLLENYIKRLKNFGFPDIGEITLSDDPKVLGRPTDFDITIREIRISAGAGFIVCLTGNVLTMPGLPKQPAALKMDVTPEGECVGLF